MMRPFVDAAAFALFAVLSATVIGRNNGNRGAQWNDCGIQSWTHNCHM